MSDSAKNRKEVIDLVTEATMSDRNRDYGDPEDNFQDIADFLNIYLADRLTGFITAIDVANIMILTKVARMRASPLKGDHMVDVAGYAVCGYACQQKAEAVIEEERGRGSPSTGGSGN